MAETYNIAVAGATGAVGTVMLKLLEERGFPVGEVRPLASAASAGSTVRFAGGELEVQEMTSGSFDGIDIALFSAGAARSREFAPAAAEAGAVVIDNSSAFRMEPSVPLVVPEVNPDDVKWHEGIIANPNCSTIQMVVALKPIHDAVGIDRIVVTTFQAVSGTGNPAIEELFYQSQKVLEHEEIVAHVYPHQIAFNALPQIEAFHDNGYTNEEMKMVNETQKIFGDPEMRVTATCVRIPVFVGHSEAVNIQTRRPVSVDEVRRLLLSAPGVVLEDDPAAGQYPMPVDAAGHDDVYVGRIRIDESADNCLNMWVVADNVRKGAATNALQIAELLAGRGLLE